MQTATSPPATNTGRRILWLGIACPVLGLGLYAAQLMAAGRTDTPWYLPALATVGVGLVLLALARRVTVWRGIAFVLVAAMAALQWWFVLGYTHLPPYTGPLAAGEAFPDFVAKRAEGTPFTRADLAGGPPTALVFFRGHW
jgi:hypothetical protein